MLFYDSICMVTYSYNAAIAIVATNSRLIVLNAHTVGLLTVIENTCTIFVGLLRKFIINISMM